MKTLIAYVLFLFFFALAFSNIIFPIFYTIPRLKKEKINKNLKKEVPLLLVLWAPILWSVLSVLLYYYILNYRPQNLYQMYGGIGSAIFGLLASRSIKKDADEDFRNTYKEYLVDEDDK